MFIILRSGSGVTVNAANIMVGRYFRSRREVAEMIVLSGTGIGAALIAFIMNQLIM